MESICTIVVKIYFQVFVVQEIIGEDEISEGDNSNVNNNTD